MKYIRQRPILAIILIFFSSNLFAQISIVNFRLNENDLKPSNLFNFSINNTGSVRICQLIIEIKNGSGQLVLAAQSEATKINIGSSNFFGNQVKVAGIQYGSNYEGKYVKTKFILPEGDFNYCLKIVELNNESNDEYCDQLKIEKHSFLSLIAPYDQDSIDMPNPTLTWTHSGDFGDGNAQTGFNIILVECEKTQSPEEAISMNKPLMYSSGISNHLVYYSPSYTKLLPGKKYSWQVQRLKDGEIQERTDVWSFYIKKPKAPKPYKYAELGDEVSNLLYNVVDGNIYIAYKDLAIEGNVTEFNIVNNKNEKIAAVVYNESFPSNQTFKLYKGDNRLRIDITQSGISSGNYKLVVTNSKDKTYFLNFTY